MILLCAYELHSHYQQALVKICIALMKYHDHKQVEEKEGFCFVLFFSISKIERKNVGEKKLYIKRLRRKPAGVCRADRERSSESVQCRRKWEAQPQSHSLVQERSPELWTCCAGRNTWEASGCCH